MRGFTLFGLVFDALAGWGVHPMEGNEAKIFIIPILGGKFGILGGTKCFCQFRRMEM